MDEIEGAGGGAGKLDGWVRILAGLGLLIVIFGNMLDFWTNDPPIWFEALLVLLALGVEITAIKRIAVDIIQKQFAKK